jgi:hypothetical protein
MLLGHRTREELHGLVLPFGYYLERDGTLLILRRSEGAFVAAFSASGVDLFEVELTLWEDAD